MSLTKKIISLLIFNILAFGASAWGSYVTNLYKEPWYSEIVKPSFNPPDWVFAPVWTTLYLMMTLAIWFYWHSKNREMNTIYIYFIHIVFNTTWSIVFFGLHQILLALIVLLILIILIIILILKFKRVNKVSSYLMIPYLLWSCYALFIYLNLYILN